MSLGDGDPSEARPIVLRDSSAGARQLPRNRNSAVAGGVDIYVQVLPPPHPQALATRPTFSSQTPEPQTCISGERFTGTKMAGFAGGLAREAAAATGAEGTAGVPAGGSGSVGTRLSPALPGRAGGSCGTIIPAPASTCSAAGASSASDSTEDSDSSSASWRRRFRWAPLRLLIS